MKLFSKILLLVYMYYTHSGKWTSIFGKNRPYYIEIFTVLHRLYSICIEVWVMSMTTKYHMSGLALTPWLKY